MSDPRRPFGDTSGEHDLRREPTTDAPNDADALDALLNEIASENGAPGARQSEPNARSEDAASVMATAAAFHRQVETAQGRDARAAGPNPQLWETIMERAGAPSASPGVTTTATANPWVAQKKTKRPRRTQPVSQRQHIWTMAANIGLVAAILLMALGAWRIAGGPGLPGNGGGNGSVPAGNFAMQPATPEGTPASSEPEPVVVQPVATPTPATACDLSDDIPIFNGVNAAQWPGTAVVLKPTGEVVLTCPEEPQGKVLATSSGRASVAPLEWPGAVLVHDVNGDPDTPRVRVVSLVTGDTVEFGVAQSESTSLGPQRAVGSPWIVGPAPDDLADVQILDLRMMETRPLSEITGSEVPNHGGYMLYSSDDGGSLVLALLQHGHPTDGNATLVTQGLPGELLALNGSLNAATWISAPEGFAPVVGFEVSPDGQHVALHGARGTMDERQHTWSIVSLEDGMEVARSATVETGLEPAEGVWTGTDFVYVDGNELMLLPVDGNDAGETVFAGDGPLTNLRATTDASIVLVDQEWSDDLATMVANMHTPTFYAVNVTTGEATTLTGVDVSANTSPWPYPTHFLVTFDYSLESRDTITYRVFDAVTGETVGTLDDVPLNESGYEGYPMLGPRSVVSSADGETEVIAFDTQHIYLMQVVDGESTVRQIAAPDGLPSQYPMMAQMFLAPDGSLLSLTAEGDEARTRWLLALDGEPDAWIAVENDTVDDDPGYILFIPGTGD